MKRFVTSHILLMLKEAKKLLLRASNASALLCCLEFFILTFSLVLTPLAIQVPGKHLNKDAYTGQILSTKYVSSESLDLNYGSPYSLKFHPIEFYEIIAVTSRLGQLWLVIHSV